MYHLECIKCGAKYGRDEVIYTCKKCDGLLDVIYDYSQINLTRESLKGPLSVWKYKPLLPVSREPITLKEGGTPIYHMKRIGEQIGLKEAYAKHEGMNPSGSFKDRGMTVGVTKALELGMTCVACASTGNTSASLAVYGARAGIPVIVLLPQGKVALGKVAQALMHGARVLSIRGNFDEALRLVRELLHRQRHLLIKLNKPVPARRPKNDRLRDSRLFRVGSARPHYLASGQRGQHNGHLQGFGRDEETRHNRPHTEDDRHPGRGQRAHRKGH